MLCIDALKNGKWIDALQNFFSNRTFGIPACNSLKKFKAEGVFEEANDEGSLLTGATGYKKAFAACFSNSRVSSGYMENVI